MKQALLNRLSALEKKLASRPCFVAIRGLDGKYEVSSYNSEKRTLDEAEYQEFEQSIHEKTDLFTVIIEKNESTV